MKTLPIWERLTVVVEVALVCLLIFKLLLETIGIFFKGNHFLFIPVIMAANYIVILICGFWTGWKIKIDGWLYAILAFGLFYMFRQLFAVYIPFRMADNLRLFMFVPALALLLVGAVYGEIAAERRDEQIKGIEEEIV